jgi:hypothetical protein
VLTSTATSQSPLVDRRIDETTAGLAASFAKQLHSISEYNATIIIKYIATMKSEVNLADHYRRDLIVMLCRFIKYNDEKTFKDLSRSDILRFLDCFRKTEAQDPLHKWIGTYNIYRIHLLRFFKWLYYPDTEPDKRPKPSLIDNIPKLRRKETSVYKPSDLWTQQDDLGLETIQRKENEIKKHISNGYTSIFYYCTMSIFNEIHAVITKVSCVQVCLFKVCSISK